MGRMSDLDIERHELGDDGLEAKLYEDIAERLASLAVLKRGHAAEKEPDLLTDTYETDESIEAKKAAGVNVEEEVARSRGNKDLAKAKGKPKEPTLEEAREKLVGYARKGFTKEIRELIVGFGANKLSEVKPEHYAEILKRMEDIVGGGR